MTFELPGISTNISVITCSFVGLAAAITFFVKLSQGPNVSETPV